MPRTTPTSPRARPRPAWQLDEDTVDGQASGPPVGPSPDSDAAERARRPRFGDSDCVFCAGSGEIDGEPCSECSGSGRTTGAHGSE
jgi:hypothetical protein